MGKSAMTDAEAIKDMCVMKQTLIRALKRQCPNFDAGFTFWVLIELAVQSGLILYGKEECLEKISSAVNYIIQREN
jgi:hypothetical protein